MDVVYQGVLVGIIATIGTDIWALIVKHVFRLPTAHWNLVGRWFGHMPRGRFIHESIAESAAIPHETAIGWTAHYLVGIVYGLLYLGVVRILLSATPTLTSALVFGIVTLVAPWLIMQPALGVGAFASKTPNPAMTRMINLSMHLAFGASLYAGWLLT